MSLPDLNRQEWGQRLWAFLHACSFNYPDAKECSPQHKAAVTALLTSLKTLIPCDDCRSHYASYVAAHPPRVDGSGELSRWMVDFHNAVNRRLGKPHVSYAIAQKMYQVGECGGGCPWWVHALYAVAIVVAIALTATLALILARRRQ